jgi:NADPH-dependent ferric siderophore reductase
MTDTDRSAASTMRVSAPKRGVNGAIMRAYRAWDVRLTVREREDVSENFVRLKMADGGLLARDDIYPSYWLRLWFTSPEGRAHQRGYTVVQPDHEAGEFWLEFYLHPGIASDWGRDAQIGDQIDASVLNGRSPLSPEPTHLVMTGDGASVPAIADVIRRMPDNTTAQVFLERGYPDDHDVLPVPDRDGITVQWFDEGGTVAETTLEAARDRLRRDDADTTSFFLCSEGSVMRRISKELRKNLGVPKDRINAQAYWTRGKQMRG